MKKNILIYFLAQLTIVIFFSSFVFAEDTEDVQFFETPVADILCDISINHEQGSIGFVIQDVHFLCYIQAEESWERIIASSALLEDIKKASTIQVKHVPYGYHRKVTNLLLFYGKREIPENLKLDMGKIKKSIAAQTEEMNKKLEK